MSRILKQVSFTRNSEGDMALLSYLDSKGAISTYIKDLIRRDMAGELADQQQEVNSELLQAVTSMTANNDKNTTSIVNAIGQLASALQGNITVSPVEKVINEDVQEEQEIEEDNFDTGSVAELLSLGGF